MHTLFLALDLAHCNAHLTTRYTSVADSVKSLVHCLLFSVEIYMNRSPHSSIPQNEAYKKKSNIISDEYMDIFTVPYKQG